MSATQSLLLERPKSATASWRETHKGHARLIELADEHYTRQQPGTNSCTRPGVNLVFLLSDGAAAWVVWRPIPEVGRSDNLEAWECTLFRNVGARLSSELVAEATALTFRKWGWPPRDGFITAVGVEQTRARRSKRSAPGECFRLAAWAEFVHPSQCALPEWPRPPVALVNTGKAWLRAPHPLRTPLEAA